MCVLIFSTTFIETFLILGGIKIDIAINVKSLHVKYALFLSNFNETWIFPGRFSKKAQI
jgi:hypothetical protein